MHARQLALGRQERYHLERTRGGTRLCLYCDVDDVDDVICDWHKPARPNRFSRPFILQSAHRVR